MQILSKHKHCIVQRRDRPISSIVKAYQAQPPTHNPIERPSMMIICFQLILLDSPLSGTQSTPGGRVVSLMTLGRVIPQGRKRGLRSGSCCSGYCRCRRRRSWWGWSGEKIIPSPKSYFVRPVLMDRIWIYHNELGWFIAELMRVMHLPF